MPVVEHTLYVPMKERTYEIANILKRDRVFIGAKGNEILADTEVKLMNKLHQVYSGTVIDEAGSLLPFDDSKVKFIKKKFQGKKNSNFL